LPPVQQGRELDSLDTAGNSETEKQPVEMSLHGAPRHVELGGDLGVVASLQQQVYDLLFARTEPNSLVLHPILPFFLSCLPHQAVTISISVASTLPFCDFSAFTNARLFSTESCGEAISSGERKRLLAKGRSVGLGSHTCRKNAAKRTYTTRSDSHTTLTFTHCSRMQWKWTRGQAGRS